MIKYAKIVNEETGLCEVGIGTDAEFYQSIGMIELDVELSDVNNNWYLAEKCPMKTDEQKEQEEKERIAKFYLTGADVERGIYQAKGMDFDDILAYVTQLQPEGLDIKALKIELKANNFYRGNPYVSAIGNLLGFTEKQLDLFFETNNHLYLTNCTLTIVPTPKEAVVTINGIEQRSITVPYETDVQFEVACEGYVSLLFNVVVTKDETFEVALEPIEIPTEATEVKDEIS